MVRGEGEEGRGSLMKCCANTEVAIELKFYIRELKFFQISKFGAERQILIFGRTSTLVSNQVMFDKLQFMRNFK